MKDPKGISTIMLLIILFLSMIIGAILSYMWTVGYYVEKGFKVPEEVTTITITNVTFPKDDASYFNITILHPSFSEDNYANITRIAIITIDNNVDVIHTIEAGSIEPPISTQYPLEKGEEVTFKCPIQWGGYAGQEIQVLIFVQDGSGGTIVYETQFIKLEVTDISYNIGVSIKQFNITVDNPSNIQLDLSRVMIGSEEISEANISANGEPITFPHSIQPDETVLFMINWLLWDSTTNSGYLGTETSLIFNTVQNYHTVFTHTFPNPVILTISNISYVQPNTTLLVLRSDQQSPHAVNLDYVTISTENETVQVNTNATGFILNRDSSIVVSCQGFNWQQHENDEMTIIIYTTQGFLAKYTENIQP